MQIPKGSLFLWEIQCEYTNILLAINSYWPPHTLLALSYINYVQYQIKNPTKYKPIKANPIHAGITGLLTFHEEDDDDFGRPISVLLDIAIARGSGEFGSLETGGLVRISNFKEEGGPVGPDSIVGSNIVLFGWDSRIRHFWL